MALLQNLSSGSRTQLCLGLAGNTVTTNHVQRRSDQTEQRPSMLRIIGTVGTACSYFLEGSPDDSFFYPLPYIDLTASGVTPAQTSALYTVAAAGTFWLLIPQGIPWSMMRVTMSGNTAMVNQIDIWCF